MKDFQGLDRATTFVILRDLGFDRAFAERVCRDRFGKAEIEYPDTNRPAAEVQAERDSGQRGIECFNGNQPGGKMLRLSELFLDLDSAGYILGFGGVIARVQGDGRTKYLAKVVYYSPAEISRLKSLGTAQSYAEAEEDSGRRELRAKVEHFLRGVVREDRSTAPYAAAHGHHNPDDSFSVYVPMLKEPAGSAIRRVRFVNGSLFTEEVPVAKPETLKAPMAERLRGNRGDDVARRR